MRRAALPQRRRRRPGVHADAGFTLVETLVSMALFVTVSTAALLAVVGGTTAAANSGSRITAANLAQAAIQSAVAAPSPSPAAYTTTPANGKARYTVSRSVVLPSSSAGTACPSGQLIRIAVSVGYSGGTVALSTVRSC